MITLSQAVGNLLGTVVVECLFAGILLRPPRLGKLVDVALINLLSNPLAQLAVAEGFGFGPVEAAVVGGEFICFHVLLRVSWRRAAQLSLVLNGATILISILLTKLSP